MLKNLHLLCIEDDPADREALRGYAEILDWNVTFAANCTDGLGLATSKGFDVIVTDQNLPDGSGLDLIRVIRAEDGPNRTTPVLLNSWGLSESIRTIAGMLLVDAMIPKPILLSTFKVEVQKLACGR